MSDERTQQIEHWMREYASKTDAQIRAAMSGWRPHAAGYIAGEMVLQQRAEARDTTRPLLTSLNERVATIDGRLATVEHVAKRSEFRTWGFWFGVVAIIVALLAFFRDYFGWTAPASAVAPQQIAPTAPPISAGSAQPHSPLSPTAPSPAVVSTAIVQQVTGSTSTPSRLTPP